DYLTLELSNGVMVTSVSTGGSGGEDRLTENITLHYGKFEYKFQPQKPDGTADGGALPFTYDIQAVNKVRGQVMSFQVSATGEKLAPSSAESLLKAGRLAEALEALTAQIRGNPADAAQRVLLFQLLAASGQWERAEAQLEAAGKLDASNLVLVAGYQALLAMEIERHEVF